jgi:hypothetical protein
MSPHYVTYKEEGAEQPILRVTTDFVPKEGELVTIAQSRGKESYTVERIQHTITWNPPYSILEQSTLVTLKKYQD